MKRKTVIRPVMTSALLLFAGLTFATDSEQTSDGQLMTDRERTEWFNQMLNTDVNGEKKKNRLQIPSNEYNPSLLSERPTRENSLTPNVEKTNPSGDIESGQIHHY